MVRWAADMYGSTNRAMVFIQRCLIEWLSSNNFRRRWAELKFGAQCPSTYTDNFGGLISPMGRVPANLVEGFLLIHSPILLHSAIWNWPQISGSFGRQSNFLFRRDEIEQSVWPCEGHCIHYIRIFRRVQWENYPYLFIFWARGAIPSLAHVSIVSILLSLIFIQKNEQNSFNSFVSTPPTQLHHGHGNPTFLPGILSAYESLNSWCSFPSWKHYSWRSQ